MDFLSKFNDFLGGAIPDVLINVLKESGYSTQFSIEQMNTQLIDKLEEYVKRKLGHLFEKSFDGFLPGHRATLLGLPKLVNDYALLTKNAEKSLEKSMSSQDGDFSFILQQLVSTAKSNADKDFRHRRFSEALQNFSMILYIMGGKAAYEILSSNIPLPQAITTCNSQIL